MNPRLFRMIETHQRIDQRLRSELRRPLPDAFKLMKLKRLKLRAKDMIRRLTVQPQGV